MDKAEINPFTKSTLLTLVIIGIFTALLTVPVSATTFQETPPNTEGSQCGSDHSNIDKIEGDKPGGFDGTFGPVNRIKVPTGKTIKSIEFRFRTDYTGGLSTVVASVGISRGGLFYKSIEQCWSSDRKKSGTIKNFSAQDIKSGDDKVTIKYEAKSNSFSPAYIGWEGYSISASTKTHRPTVIINYKQGGSEKIPVYQKIDSISRVNTAPNQMKKAPPYSEPAVIGKNVNVTRVTGTNFSANTVPRGEITWFGVKNMTQRVPQWYREDFIVRGGPFNHSQFVGIRNLHKFNKSSRPLLIGYNMSPATKPRVAEINIRYGNRSPDQIEYTGPEPYDDAGLLLPPNATYLGTVDEDSGYCTRDRPIVVGGDGEPCRVIVKKDLSYGPYEDSGKDFVLTVREYLMMFSRDYDVPGRLDEAQIKSQGSIKSDFAPGKKKKQRNLRATESVVRATLAADKRFQQYPIEVPAMNAALWGDKSKYWFDNNFGPDNPDTLKCGKGVSTSTSRFMSACNTIHNIRESLKLYISSTKTKNIIPKQSQITAVTSTAWNIDPDEKINDTIQGDGVRKFIKGITDDGGLDTCLVRNVPPSRVRGNLTEDPCSTLPDHHIIKDLEDNRFTPKFTYKIDYPDNTTNISLVSYQKGEYTVFKQKWDSNESRWVNIDRNTVKTGVAAVSHIPNVRITSTNITARISNIRSEENTSNTTAKEYYVDISTDGMKSNFWGSLSINGTNTVVSQWEFLTWRDKTWDFIHQRKVKKDVPEGGGVHDTGGAYTTTDPQRLRMRNNSDGCVGTYVIGPSELSGAGNAENVTIGVFYWNGVVRGSGSISVRHRVRRNNSTQLVWTESTSSIFRRQAVMTAAQAEFPIKKVRVTWESYKNRTAEIPVAPRRIRIKNNEKNYTKQILVTPVDACKGGADIQQTKTKLIVGQTTPMDVVAIPTEKPEAIGGITGYTTIKHREFIRNNQGEPKNFSSPYGKGLFPENVQPGVDLNGSYRQTSALVVRHSPNNVYTLPSSGSEYPQAGDLTNGTMATKIYDVSKVGEGDLNVYNYKNESLSVEFTHSPTTVQPVEITHDYDSGSDTLTITVRRMDGSPISRQEARGIILYNGTRYKLPADGTLTLNVSGTPAGSPQFVAKDWWKLDEGKTGYIDAKSITGVSDFQAVDDWIDYVLLNFGAPAFLVLSFYWLVRRDYFLSRLGFSD